MKNFTVAFLFMWLSLTAYAKLPSNINKSFYRVDKYFIASLYASSQNNKALFKHDFNLLKKEWNIFTKKYKGKNKNDHLWDHDLKKIKNMLSKISADNTEKAHISLEEIRPMLTDMRTRNGISYYIDTLNRFHKPMEVFYKNVVDKQNKKWNENDFDTISIIFDSLTNNWNSVKNIEFDEDLFGFSEKDMDTMEQLSKNCDDALNHVQKALKSQVPEKIEKSARDLKKAFVSFYIFFGGIKNK